MALVFVISLAAAPSAAQSELFGAAHFGGGPSSLYEIDPASGGATLVGPIGFNRISGMDFAQDGTLYATAERSGSGVPVLITIDTTTAFGTEVGPTGTTGALADLSFRSDETLFAYDANAPDHTLYTLSLTTGAATLVGSTGLSFNGGNGIAFDHSDTLFHSNRTFTHTLDPTNGAANPLSPFLGVDGVSNDSERIAAADLDPLTGQIFGVCKDCLFDTQLVTVDYASGAATTIGSTQPGLDALAFAGFVVPVEIDIKPGGEQNPVNPRSRGVTPVALLGSEEFDVTEVDETTLAFGPDGAPPSPNGGNLQDANGDGFLDLVLHYRTAETGITDGDEEACLTGELLDGTPFAGCDALRTVPPVDRGNGGGGPPVREATLYGVTGDGANVSESLFILSQEDATPTSVGALGNGNDGEAIADNPDDGLLYHASGLGAPNVDEIFETIDPTACCVPTQIFLSGEDYNEATALTYMGGGEFFLVDLDRTLNRVTVDGTVSFVGAMDHLSKGLAVSLGVLYSVSRDDVLLREIDPTSGVTTASIPITIPGTTIFGANGLAAHPATGELWAILKLSGQSGRELATIDPATGIATRIGNTGDRFAGLAFVGGRQREECGLGFELALILPGLMWLRRRRRH